jgi:hypothetical protein
MLELSYCMIYSIYCSYTFLVMGTGNVPINTTGTIIQCNLVGGFLMA